MLPEPIVALLRRQYGVVAEFQLSELLSYNGRRCVIRDRTMERRSPRVLRQTTARRCPEQELMAAVLDAGPAGVLWGKTAAAFWGFGYLSSRRPHVAVRRSNVREPRLGSVHALRHLDERAVTTHHDLPISRPEDTILWTAGMFTHRYGPTGLELAVQRTAVMLDHAWRMGLINGARVHELCDRSGGRGRSGIVVLRQVLEDRPPNYRPSGSALEERFESILPVDLRSRLERQVAVGGSDAPIGVVDYRHRSRPLVVEINGEVFHTSHSDRAADEKRYADLMRAGYAVMVVWEQDVFYRPAPIVRALRSFERAPFEPGLIRPTPAPWTRW
ncbi:MAG: DUF559 domain-containing protein [Actinomycetota bacterium]|nr:DUF559 domain-containing protein [Actinomycetota bacterium]